MYNFWNFFQLTSFIKERIKYGPWFHAQIWQFFKTLYVSQTPLPVEPILIGGKSVPTTVTFSDGQVSRPNRATLNIGLYLENRFFTSASVVPAPLYTKTWQTDLDFACKFYFLGNQPGNFSSPALLTALYWTLKSNSAIGGGMFVYATCVCARRLLRWNKHIQTW